MSLTPIVMTFAIVAVVFIAAIAASERLTGPPASWSAAIRAVWLDAAVEALLVVLLSSLWFASLGHGGWLLIFLLLGGLVAGTGCLARHRRQGTPMGLELKALALGLLRYVAAGLASAWLLT